MPTDNYVATEVRYLAILSPYEAMRRLMTKVERVDSGCWEWRGATNAMGYGTLRAQSKKSNMQSVRAPAHRVAYTIFAEPIPPGMVIDHVRCSNPPCVNPDHMQVVTRADNSTRNFSPATTASRLNVCRSGRHELVGDNVMVLKSGLRQCRECRRERRRLNPEPPRKRPPRTTPRVVYSPVNHPRYKADVDNNELLRLREAGMTYKALAEHFGFSAAASARDRYLLALRMREQGAA